MNKTKIEYGDERWNPIRGCKGIGCAVKDKCWAKGMNNRFHYIRDFNTPEFDYEELTDLRMSKIKPSRILTCFMGDFFGKGVRPWWRQEIYRVIKGYPQHTYFILTKHPERLTDNDLLMFPENARLGVTINKQKGFDKLYDYIGMDSIKFWISFEPLLSDILIKDYVSFEWFIIGGMQFGREPRPKTEWIENILKQASQRNIPIWMKNNLRGIWPGTLRQEYPNE